MNKKLKILHLEDLQGDAELVKRVLKKGKIDCEYLVVDAKEAYIIALQEFNPDVVLSDHTLPSFDSHEALAILQDTGLKIPFILVTATVSEEFAVDVIKRGAEDYILKDRPERLPSAIRNALEKFSREKEREQMIHSQAHLASMINSSSDSIISEILDGTITSWNLSAEKLFGYSAAEAMGKNISIIIPTGHLHEESDFLERIKKGEPLQHLETVRLTRTGARVDVLLTISPLNDNDGKIIGAVKIFHDITERKKIERQLADSEQFSKSILASLSSHIAVIDHKGNVIAVNKAWDDFANANGFNALTDVLVGSNYFEVCERSLASGDMIAGQASQGIRSVFSKEIKNFELEYPCHSLTQQRWFNLSVTSSGEDDFKAVVSHQNITKRKIAEQELEKSEFTLKEAQAVANIGSWETDLQTLNATWSEQTHHIFATDPNKFQATHEAFLSFIHPDDRNKVNTAFEKSVNSQQINSIEHSVIATNGMVKHVIENWRIFRDGEGLPVRAAGTCQDITERKIAEANLEIISDELAIISERLLLATTSAKMGVWDWDIEKDIMNWDKRMYELYGIGAQQFTGAYSVWQKGVHPDDIERAAKELNDAVKGVSDFNTEFRVVWPDGSIHFIEAHATVSRNEAGVGVRMIGVNIDITERKAAEEKVIKLNEEVAKSEKFFKNVIENSDDMITMLDHKGKTLYASPAVSRKFGYTPAECLNLNIADIVHPADAVIMQQFVGKIMRHPGVPMECPLIRDKKKDGTYMWVEGTLTNFLETEGINAIVANFSDVTERKKADEENRFKANLLNTIGQSAIATDLNGVVTYCNQAAENIYGWTKEEALGRSIIDLTTSEDTNEQSIQVMEALKQGQSWSGEFKVRKKDGTNFTALVTNSPIYDENNIISGIIGISSDITEIKKLEKLLGKTSSLAAVGSWEIDVVKGTVFWSDTTKEIREVGKDYVPQLEVGIGYFKAGIHKDIISQKVKACIEHGTPWDEELQITTFQGNDKWVRTIGEGEFLNGKCIKIHGTFQDINERKKAQLELLKVYEEKNAILESIEDGFFAVDTNWIITYWNKQSEKMLHRSNDEMIGKNLWEVYSHNIGSPFYIYFNKAIAENAVQRFESYSKTLETWYELSAYPSANGLSVYFRDITKRILSEQQVKADKILLRALIDHLPDTIYYKDKSAKKIISNKFDYTVLGAESEQEVLGKTDLEMSSHPHASVTYAQDMEILTTGNSLINFEEYFTTADNEPLWLLTTKLALRNENNEIIGLLGIGRDITQRKVAEDKLIEVNKALEKNIKQLVVSNAELEQFAYVASHDLQEPLRMITSFLTLLEKRYSDQLDDKGKQYIDFAVDGGKRMRQIILDLLEFSRVGRTEDKLEKVDLNELINEILSLQSQQIKDVKAQVQMDTLPILNSYRSPLRQVFQNLINNGLKYHREGVAPEISISVISAGQFWQFAISDNGIGIGGTYLDKIFIIFQRLHNKERYSGTGIGLAITKKIIESLGGRIWVESEEGTGSTFLFTIKK